MNSVVKKSIIAVTGALALVVAGGSSVHAYTSWQAGKEHLNATSDYIDGLVDHINDIKAVQNKKIEEVNTLQAKADDLQKKIDVEKGITTGLKKELFTTHTKWSEDVKEKEKEKETIQNELKTVKEQISEKEQTIKQNETEITRLNDELAKAKTKSSADDKKISELEQAIDDARILREKAEKAYTDATKDQPKNDQAKQQ